MKPIVRGAILLESVLILLAWIIGVLLGISPWQGVGLTWPAIGWGVVTTLPLIGGMIWSLNTQWRVIVQLRRLMWERVIPFFADCNLFELGLISIFAGVGEELFFRGLMQTGLVNVSSLWVGLIITSIIFGLVHFVSLTYAILAGLIGLYLGLLLVAFDNLTVPMIAHALYDFIALIFLVRIGSPGKESQV